MSPVGSGRIVSGRDVERSEEDARDIEEWNDGEQRPDDFQRAIIIEPVRALFLSCR